MTTLYAVRRPNGTIVQAAPCAEKEAALWEAAGRDPEVKAIWNPESNYNVAVAKRRGYEFVEAEVVAKGEAQHAPAGPVAGRLKRRKGR